MILRRVLLPLALALSALGLTAAAAQAAGAHTHAAMAVVAAEHVEDPRLRAILRTWTQEYRSGAFFPDSGYIARSAGFADYGETSHWARFTEAYADHLRATPLCRLGLRSPAGPCARRIAHLMGVATHGMGDETWDWLFEPSVRDQGERASVLGPEPIGTVEYAMDEVLLGDGGIFVSLPLYLPATSTLLDIYRSYGRADVTAAALLAGLAAQNVQAAAQQLAAPVEGPRVRALMPRSAATFMTAPGGVQWSGRAVAGYLDALWDRLTGEAPTLRVVATAPADGATGLPATGWQPPRTSPGPLGGGARTRIVAVFNGAPTAASVTGSSIGLRHLDGSPVALSPGTPTLGPYGEAEGTHSVLLHPAEELEPCTSYVAEVSGGVRDRQGVGATPYSWRFTTEGC